MVIKYTSRDGQLRIHEPPYTKAEEADFYRRNAGGPVTIVRSADDRKGSSSRRRQSQRAPGIREQPRPKADIGQAIGRFDLYPKASLGPYDGAFTRGASPYEAAGDGR
jgi:hypothetical protein